MERRHDRPSVRGFDVDGVSVHTDIEAAVADAEDEQCHRERPRVRRQCRQHERRAEQRRTRRYDAPRPEPVGQRPGKLHTGERAAAEQEQQPAEDGVAHADVPFDRRNVDDPDSQYEAVEGEVHERGYPGRAQ